MKTRQLIRFVLVASLVLVCTWTAAAQTGWLQSNTSGFGDASNSSAAALTSFAGQLYAGTLNDSGAQLWRLGGSGWVPVMSDGFANSNNVGIDYMIVFGEVLYAGTINDTQGGGIWRSNDGSAWNQVVSGGFGNSNNAEIMHFAIFGDHLYASTWNYATDQGAEIWRSPTGDSGDWTQVVSNGFNGDTNNGGILSFAVFHDMLYAGTFNTTTGGEVWRSSNGTTWDQVNTDGFGTNNNRAVAALAVFSDTLYASTNRPPSSGGIEVWRCQSCDGGDWTRVVENGFGNADNRLASALETYNAHLYSVIGNYETGVEVWRSSTGDSGDWEQVGTAGFGDSNNRSPNWDNSVAVFNNALYVGTWNPSDGGEVWSYFGKSVYLPIVLRNY